MQESKKKAGEKKAVYVVVGGRCDVVDGVGVGKLDEALRR